MTLTPFPARSAARDSVAGEVRAEMSRHRIRMSDLARELGGSHTYWSRRINGQTAFDVDDLEAVAGLLGCSVIDFFARVDRVVRREGIEPPTRWLRPAPAAWHRAAA